MSLAPYLSVVVPCFDERENVESLHAEIVRALGGVNGGFELIYVDDGSRDGTGERLAKIAAEDALARVITFPENRGQTAALDAGFRAARGELIATLDGDGQNDPADLPRLIAALTSADVVNGVRADRKDGALRRLSSRIGNGFRNWATGDRVSDVGCSLRVMRAVYVKRVKLFRGMHRFLPTLLRMEGARVVELPVSHRPRRAGRSKYGIANRLFVGIADVLAVRWMLKRRLPRD
ncbi:MAG TPA: glycosyltransferase family 2 protein [Myxococcota bacterium]|nr:glycosyltransferase family 2 protein [Myxococcota bacterium]